MKELQSSRTSSSSRGGSPKRPKLHTSSSEERIEETKHNTLHSKRPPSFGRPTSSRSQIPSRPRSNSEGRNESDELSTQRPASVRTKRPRPVFEATPAVPNLPSSTPSTNASPRSQRLKVKPTPEEEEEPRTQRPARPSRPSRPRPVFSPKRPQRPQRPNTSTSQPSILPPIQLKAKDQEGEVELPAVEPLSEEEKAVQKSQRNDLFNLLSKNRKGGRGGGGRSSRPAPDTT